jgi:signal transduction histidine kinase
MVSHREADEGGFVVSAELKAESGAAEGLVDQLIERIGDAGQEWPAAFSRGPALDFATLVPDRVACEIAAPAAARARALAEAGGSTSDATVSAAFGFAAEVLLHSLVDPGSNLDVDDLLSRVVEASETTGETARVELLLRLSRSPRLDEFPPRVAAEIQLRALMHLFGSTHASLWFRTPTDGVDCVVHVGTEPTRRMHAAAMATATGNAAYGVEKPRRRIHSVPVSRWGRDCGALVVRGTSASGGPPHAVLHELAATLAPTSERERLLKTNAASERALVRATEKRLLRLGFDLHDGPLQDLSGLATEVRRLHNELPQLARARDRQRLSTRFEALEERVVALDGALREIAQSFSGATSAQQSLELVLRGQVSAFLKNTDIRLKLDVHGSLEFLSPSQRIAIFRIVQEALSNIRDHSGAAAASIRISNTSNGVEVDIADDGEGFDVDTTLIGAARRGRLGLVGVAERVRLLGGSFDVRSAPGAGTRLELTLPRWTAATDVQGHEL